MNEKPIGGGLKHTKDGSTVRKAHNHKAIPKPFSQSDCQPSSGAGLQPVEQNKRTWVSGDNWFETINNWLAHVETHMAQGHHVSIQGPDLFLSPLNPSFPSLLLTSANGEGNRINGTPSFPGVVLWVM